MFSGVRGKCLAAAIAFAAVLAVPVSVAQASNSSIVATFKAANPHLNADEAAVTKAVAKYKRNHKARPVIAALRHEVRDIRAVNHALKSESASTRKGARGKADITRGLSLIGNAYSTLANDIQKAKAGHPVPSSKIVATINSDRKGRAKLLAGLRLLGVKVKG